MERPCVGSGLYPLLPPFIPHTLREKGVKSYTIKTVFRAYLAGTFVTQRGGLAACKGESTNDPDSGTKTPIYQVVSKKEQAGYC